MILFVIVFDDGVDIPIGADEDPAFLDGHDRFVLPRSILRGIDLEPGDQEIAVLPGEFQHQAVSGVEEIPTTEDHADPTFRQSRHQDL